MREGQTLWVAATPPLKIEYAKPWVANTGVVRKDREGKKMAEIVIAWYLDLAFAGNVCIGRVHQLPAGPDPVSKGMVQKQANWQAYEMAEKWEDTNLGNHHGSKEMAMVAIVEWHRDKAVKKSQQVKKACEAHFSYRPGCVMCEAANTEKK